MTSTRRFTLVPRIETVPALVRLAQRIPGKLAILACIALGLWLHNRRWWPEMTAILAALTFFPTKRRLLIAAGTLWWLVRYTPFQWGVAHEFAKRWGVGDAVDWRILKPAAVMLVLASCVGFNVLLRLKERPRFLRRPIALLLTAFVTLECLVTGAPMNDVVRVCLFAFLIVLVRYVWFLAYSVIYPEPARSPFLIVGQYLPFWFGGSENPNPFPKGAGYLDKIEAKNAEELAVCQLKALKLLLWAGILAVIRKVVYEIDYGSGSGALADFSLHLPLTPSVLAQSAAGIAQPVGTTLLALLADFADDMLVLTIWGHVLIACARASGFKALRNTYRPLESTTIADFWNRYYFYFKEVLVDVFFYPTYFRYLKTHPRVRKFAATLAAATFGNFLYHYLRDIELMGHVGPWNSLVAKQSYLFYCVVLGLGIGVSQLRARRNASAEHWSLRRVWRPAVVLGFYCLLKVFEIPGPATLGDRLAFLASLVGWRTT